MWWVRRKGLLQGMRATKKDTNIDAGQASIHE